LLADNEAAILLDDAKGDPEIAGLNHLQHRAQERSLLDVADLAAEHVAD
jgi:hypothetical protein